MSPVEPSGRGHVGRAALVSLVAVILVFTGLWLVTVTLGKRDSPDLKLGDQTFNAGGAEKMAEQIADNGPVLYPDVSGRMDRDLILQHLGDDPEKGWYAFDARPLDKARGCFWQWQEAEELFRATCDDTVTAPPDGEGLTQYRVDIEDGRVVVDLNYEARQEYERDRREGQSTTTAA